MVPRALAAEAGMAILRPSQVSDADTTSFHTVRPRLFGIAYRVLGCAAEANDVVQDAWIRWQGTDRSKVRDAAAFLATTTTRLAINVSQSARANREAFIGLRPDELVDTGSDPLVGTEQRDTVAVALHTLLERLSPSERAVYLLREAFDYPYRDIGDLLELSEVNARQLCTRARRRIGGDQRRPVSVAEHQRLLEVFLAAAHDGDVARLVHLLSGEVTRGELAAAA